MANIIGGIICPNNHLSIKAIEYQGINILLKAFLIIDWFESFKSNLFNLEYLFSHYKISMIYRPIKTIGKEAYFFKISKINQN